MYEAFYGLTEKPFNLTPDPRFLFLSEKHKEAFAHLMYGIKNRTGFIMVSGEIGTGKTTICRSLLNQLDPDVELAFIFNPCLSPEELLRTINEDFGIKSTARTIKDLIDELNAYLLDQYAKGKNCVLVIDESQNLATNVLEQIRLLSNLETETQKLLQIILIGQPELAQHLQLPELRQLNQRVTARYHLKPLNRDETVQYIAYRLRVAGGRRKVRFTVGALRKIYSVSGGTPRVINALCDRTLLIGYTKEVRHITTAIVKRAAKELRGETFKNKGRAKSLFRRFLPSPVVIPTAAVIFLAFLLARYFMPLGYFVPENFSMQSVDAPATPAAKFAARTRYAAPRPSGSHVELGNEVPYLMTPAEAGRLPGTKDDADKKADRVELTKLGTGDKAHGLAAIQSADLPSPSGSFADRIAKADAYGTLKAAVTGVFSCWHMAIVSGFPKDDTVESIEECARTNGMSLELLSPALDQLIALNLPALVSVNVDWKQVWVAVTGVKSGKLRIVLDAPEPIEVARDEFRDVYAGKALIFWLDQKPTRDHALTPSTSGPEVVEIQEQLRELGRFTGKLSGLYNEETARAVARIEAETGILVDGIAGKQVRMVLAAWLSKNGIPTLRPSSATPHVEASVPEAAPDEKAPVEPAHNAAPPNDKPATEKVEHATAPPSPVVPSGPASTENTKAGNALPPLVMGPSEEKAVSGVVVEKTKVGVEALPPVPKNDSLAPLKSDNSKEVTPPLTGNMVLVPRNPADKPAQADKPAPTGVRG